MEITRLRNIKSYISKKPLIICLLITLINLTEIFSLSSKSKFNLFNSAKSTKQQIISSTDSKYIQDSNFNNSSYNNENIVMPLILEEGLLTTNLIVNDISRKVIIDTGSFITWYFQENKYSSNSNILNSKDSDFTGNYNGDYITAIRLKELLKSKDFNLKFINDKIISLTYKTGYVNLLREKTNLDFYGNLLKDFVIGYSLYMDSSVYGSLPNIQGLLALGVNGDSNSNEFSFDNVIDRLNYQRDFSKDSILISKDKNKSNIGLFYFDFEDKFSIEGRLIFIRNIENAKNKIKLKDYLFSDIITSNTKNDNDNNSEYNASVQQTSWTIKINSIKITKNKEVLYETCNNKSNVNRYNYINSKNKCQLMFDSGSSDYLFSDKIFNSISNLISVNEFCLNYEDLPNIDVYFSVRVYDEIKNSYYYKEVFITLDSRTYISKQTVNINYNKEKERISFEKCTSYINSYNNNNNIDNNYNYHNKSELIIFGNQFLRYFSKILFDFKSQRIGIGRKYLENTNTDLNEVQNNNNNINNIGKNESNEDSKQSESEIDELEEKWIEVFHS